MEQIKDEYFKIGETVQLKGGNFRVVIKGFKSIGVNKMIETDYGDFNIDLIDKLNEQNT